MRDLTTTFFTSPIFIFFVLISIFNKNRNGKEKNKGRISMIASILLEICVFENTSSHLIILVVVDVVTTCEF